MQSLTRDLELQDYVEFKGTINNPEQYLSACDLFVLPSVFEGLGLVIIEAFRAGLPVIASNLEGPSEIIKNMKNGILFEASSSNDLASKISLLLNDERLCKHICEGALTTYRNEFNLANYVDKLLEVYKN
jgi:glycosyltransferase involved in cell wall biosynthesis